MEIILVLIGSAIWGLISNRIWPNDPEPRPRVELPREIRK